MNKLFFILLVIAIFIGCDQEMNQKPDELLPEETPLEIPVDFTDIEPLPKPTIPEGADVLETDIITHYTQHEWDNSPYAPIFESAVDATKDEEEVIPFFKDVKRWAQANCGKANIDFSPSLFIRFTSRAERQAFNDALPDNLFLPEFGVEIINSTDIYYSLFVVVAVEPCAFFEEN